MSRHTPAPDDPGHLGFAFRVRKTGEVELLHRGKLAATLRGTEAKDFIGAVEASDSPQAQQLMARLTGNYKHGNERTASAHARNRR